MNIEKNTQYSRFEQCVEQLIDEMNVLMKEYETAPPNNKNLESARNRANKIIKQYEISEGITAQFVCDRTNNPPRSKVINAELAIRLDIPSILFSRWGEPSYVMALHGYVSVN